LIKDNKIGDLRDIARAARNFVSFQRQERE
jgi:hypothetical protein